MEQYETEGKNNSLNPGFSIDYVFKNYIVIFIFKKIE